MMVKDNVAVMHVDHHLDMVAKGLFFFFCFVFSTFFTEHFGRCQPSVSRIVSWIKKQVWRKNRPDASRVLASGMPSGGMDTPLDGRVIQKMVRRQNWKGLLVMEIEDKGRRVVTTRPFVN